MDEVEGSEIKKLYIAFPSDNTNKYRRKMSFLPFRIFKYSRWKGHQSNRRKAEPFSRAQNAKEVDTYESRKTFYMA
jgi:hypothetical protein